MFKTIVIGLLCLCSTLSKAQNIAEDIDNIVLDLTGLAKSYITPAAEGVAHQTTNGWFSSAYIDEQAWQITASVQANLLFIPNKRRSFLVDETQLRNIRILGPATAAQAPTSIGDNNTIELEGNIGEEVFEFDTPEGINEETFWHPQLQVGVTLPYRSEFILRFAPEVSISDAKYQSYGVGIHHNLSQWLNFFQDTSWHLSTLIYYTHFDVKTSFSEIDLILGTLDAVESNSSAFGFNVIGSKSFNNLTFTGAFNLTSSNYKYAIGGNSDVLLQILNTAIENINNNQSFVTGNIGARYEWDNFSAFSSLSFGEFQNLIIGVNYTFNKNRNHTTNRI